MVAVWFVDSCRGGVGVGVSGEDGNKSSGAGSRSDTSATCADCGVTGRALSNDAAAGSAEVEVSLWLAVVESVVRTSIQTRVVSVVRTI